MKRHPMVSSDRLFSIVALLISVAAVFGSWSCTKGDYAGKTESITVGLGSTESDALIHVADDRKFFAANGLDVHLRQYDSGAAAADAMLKKEVDMATATEFVIVGKALKKEKILDIGTIAGFQNEFVIGRTDRKIKEIGDLKGKRIGVARHASSEFFLSRFLDLHGMNIGQVTMVDIPPAKAVDAIVNGEVDAIIAWEPNVGKVRERMSAGVGMWPAQSAQMKYWNVIGTDSWIRGHSEPVKRFLKSLAEADDYVVHHADETRVILKKRLHHDDAYIARVWPQYRFFLSLDQTLIVAMKMKHNG